MRAVLDANVLISAAIGFGPPRRVLHLWRTSRSFELIACPRLLEEVTAVLLERPRMRRLISPAAARSHLDALIADAETMPDPADFERFTRDPNDDYLVALARLHDADVIVSGDRDLLEWEEQSPPVVTPAAFEAMLTSTG
ncbi:putative toxin-antitoxin system toxin component, PIN family [Candidatus Poriferisodalis sp.]|uniref:putative toxin-antitoxin system toxin component, PIN family n=1 Tax=Candidatus Poriferisodalis sp. TaxID=3101277 RepID=UPI003B5C1361